MEILLYFFELPLLVSLTVIIQIVELVLNLPTSICGDLKCDITVLGRRGASIVGYALANRGQTRASTKSTCPLNR